MKKIILNSFVAIIIVTLLSSCAGIHSGMMQNSAALSSANFSYTTMHAKGTASASYIFGIGGLGRATLVDDAKQALLASNPLQNNQALANLTVNFKSSVYAGFVFRQVTCTVTADIVTFNK